MVSVTTVPPFETTAAALANSVEVSTLPSIVATEMSARTESFFCVRTTELLFPDPTFADTKCSCVTDPKICAYRISNSRVGTKRSDPDTIRPRLRVVALDGLKSVELLVISPSVKLPPYPSGLTSSVGVTVPRVLLLYRTGAVMVVVSVIEEIAQRF
jgi:hypothetical protein